MKEPELLGIIFTVGLVLVVIAFASTPTLTTASDGKVYGCGTGTFFHVTSNSCESYPPEVKWENAEKQLMDDIMQQQRDEFYP